ncbi:MAG: hypothetical protein Terrestrivirus3_167 [Terrestrivirus sp.]|uniref:Uncharacterized protein n=1 Tax=Terrestrivirus sp. TaxID=2487775 RepID=A0A3G4ZM38_9VIRU|nr:MAG: hypothetical protein Terrestrivirus3_167 [Terrestrivirus sp.]
MTRLFIVFVFLLINSVIAVEQCKQDKQIETNNEKTNIFLMWIILILLFSGIGVGADDRNH